jgi:hypothetical protein
MCEINTVTEQERFVGSRSTPIVTLSVPKDDSNLMENFEELLL